MSTGATPLVKMVPQLLDHKDIFFWILYWAPLARPSKGAHDLAISGRGSAKMSRIMRSVLRMIRSCAGK